MDTEKTREYIETLYPIRRTPQQKREFREWLMKELRRAGWKVQEETYGKTNGSINVIAGDPDKAAVFLCAHYDTAGRMLVPDFECPTNPLAYICYHLVAALGLIAAAFLLSLAVSFPLNKPELMVPLFVILLVAGIGLMAFGPANTHNANNNTSGVLALLRTAQEAKFDKRICLVFLDNNEKNLQGAAGFKRSHPGANSGLVVNLDAVGDGEDLLLMPSKYSRWDGELLDALGEAFPEGEGVRPHVLTKGLHYYPSDHRRYKFHVAVCACRHLAGLGYYIPHLYTKKDTTLRVRNVDYIAESLARFLPLYLDRAEDTNKA